MFNRAVYDSLRMSTKSPTVDINYCDSICRGLFDKIQIMPIVLRIVFEATWVIVVISQSWRLEAMRGYSVGTHDHLAGINGIF